MTEVGFYHLTRSTIIESLPPLLHRTLMTGERAVVRCRSQQRVRELDDELWRSQDYIWLPHGTSKQGYASDQPIWITNEDDVPNNAAFLFLIDGAQETVFRPFIRIFDLFDGRNELAIQAAQERWELARESGCKLVYWEQKPQGWVRGLRPEGVN